ncbi:MAG: VWA domain-containing protein [Verrucomicrobia bacterium]|nr:VWA domain-containing protein [Verrucomicrobiota bacterium]
MNFAQPLWLLAGVVACAALVWQYRRYDLAQRVALSQFAAERLLHKLTTSVSASRRRAKRMLFTLGIGLLFVALARPQAGFEWQETHRKGLELLFAVDTSKSMLAQDMKPDRLTRAKLGVKDLVAKLKGDGVGLVAFAGNAFLQCPVTLDYDAFRESLDALDTTTIPHGGTDMAAAIRESEAVFKTRTTSEKILVLITDGEDLGGEGIAAAEAAAKKGIKIFTVGVGGAKGELVPVPNENGGTDFARDENGQFVKSHLDEETLKKIAEATGGMYQPLGSQGEGLTKIYEEGLASFTREDLSARQAKVPLEKFYWPLLAALLCLVGEMLIGNRRTIRQVKEEPVPVKKKPVPGLRPATAALALFAGVMNANAASPQSAEEAYQKGDFTKAQQEYAETAAKQPASAELHFNAGSAAYKAGDYAQAVTGFQQSLNTDQVALQHDAYYNLGNTQYRLGQKTGKDNPQETIKTWEEAVKSYDAALQIAANDTEAKHNRDLVQKKIDELKKQEEQKKQDQQKQDQKDQQQNQQQSQDQKSESKDSQKDSQDQKNDSKDSKGGNKDDAQKDSKDQKDNAKDNQSAGKDQKNTPQESKGDEQKKPEESKGEQADAKKEEPKDQKAGEQPRSGDEKKDQQADAKSGQGEQPKPVDAGKKPSQGDIQAANGEQPQDAQAAAAAADEQQREPGQMTKEEARHLLDALKGDERQVPSISARGRAASQPNDRKKLKDW